jgi:flavin reductase (DIM6/NTAB) family NADH-FMN oxidoreductase RutF
LEPLRRVRDNTTKHTLQNVEAIPEVVINVVTYDMVQQMSLASTEYPKGVDEFVKSGFTGIASDLIRPLRVKESPVQFECKVNEIIHLGDSGGAGNLILCEILRIHVADAVLDAQQGIDQQKIDLVSRMGGNWYCRAHGEALFEVEKPLTTLGIGVDALPEPIRLSPILTGNQLGQLGNLNHLPSSEDVAAFKASGEAELLLQEIGASDFASHRAAAKLLNAQEVSKAALLLLSDVH